MGSRLAPAFLLSTLVLWVGLAVHYLLWLMENPPSAAYLWVETWLLLCLVMVTWTLWRLEDFIHKNL